MASYTYTRWRIVGLGIVLVLAVIAGSRVPWNHLFYFGPRTAEFVIPRGMAAHMRAGGVMKMLPGEIMLTVGQMDTLVIRNEDVADMQVGGLTLAPGQEYRQAFTRSGIYELTCSLQEAETIRVTVRDP